MSEYFRPLRRKVGVVTLLLSCLLAGMWVRSLRVDDYLNAYAGERSTDQKHCYDLFSAVSASGTLYLGKIWSACDDVKELEEMLDYYRFPRWISDHEPCFPDGDIQYDWQFCGFGLYEREPGDPYCGGWRLLIPYWSIVMPPIVLSAFLLWRRPRATNVPSELKRA